jgi:integrase
MIWATRETVVSDYLQLRGKTWYAVLDVPKDVRDILGKTKFKQSLKTHSRKEAKPLAHLQVASWKRQIEIARIQDPNIDTAKLLAEEHRRLRRAWKEAKDADKQQAIDALNAFYDHVSELAEDLEARGKVLHVDDYDGPITDTTDTAVLFAKVATNRQTLVTEYLDKWLNAVDLKPVTAYEYRNTISALAERHKFLQDVTKAEAREWINKLSDGGNSKDTIAKKFAALRGYWQWLMDQGYLENVDTNPWEGLKPKANKQRSSKTSRKAMPDDIGSKLLLQIKHNSRRFPDDYHIALILVTTGLRLEEACSLTVADVSVKDDMVWLDITDTKTKAGERSVPVIYPVIQAFIKDRIKDRKGSDRLFKSLKPNSMEQLSRGPCKRFGRHLARLGLSSEDKQGLGAAHSWRHRAATLLEQGDIPPHLISWFLGHERLGESLGRYSKGPSDAQLIEAAKAITIPNH